MDEETPRPIEGQVTLTQMLGALDKDVAAEVEKKLKKISKKKVAKVPLDKNKADQVQRKLAYSTVAKEVNKWEPIVKRNRESKQLRFPLDQEPDILEPISSSLAEIKPTTELEKEVQNVITHSQTALRDNKELSKAEEKYLKAISAEEAEKRHRELQRMRVLLSSYASKMRRQKAIKSKSYRRLLKHERIRNHVKKVESNKDLLLDEIERLQRLRAKERASLKHKNTGKWAKHAKFRAKYDDAARQAMIEQIGLAEKYLEKPAMESESEEDDDDPISEVSEDSASEAEDNKNPNERLGEEGDKNSKNPTSDDRIIVSNELINSRLRRKRKNSARDDSEGDGEDDEGDEEMDDDEDEQRKLMSEAFADDDVVDEFRKAKDQMADEEQPKDVDTFLPGWGSWTGPGVKTISEQKRSKFIIKAKKIKRKDENLGNVIISEYANNRMKDLMISKLPRGFKNDGQLEKMLTRPTTATFTSQSTHRESIQPRISTKMGARIEPISQKVLNSNKAKWG